MLAGAQVFAGIGFFVGIAVIALLAAELSGTAALAGLPPAVGIAASALAAPPASALMARSGRRPGLVACFALATVGSLIVAVAALLPSFALLCAGAAAFGVANTAILLARYAAADLSPPDRRARSIGVVLLATTVGALAGPNLGAPVAELAESLGAPGFSATFLLSAAGFAIAASMIGALLRPDPLLASRRLEAPQSEVDDQASEGVAWSAPALVALVMLVGVSAAMIGVMTMTPLHLVEGGGSLGSVGLVLSLHFGAMFLPSPVSGWAADRFGRRPLMIAGALAICLAGILAGLGSATDTTMIAVALVLLGLGWNLGLVSASALLTDSTPAPARPRAQGYADLAMSFAGGTASLGSGLLLAHTSFALLAGVGAAIGLGLALMALMTRRRSPAYATR